MYHVVLFKMDPAKVRKEFPENDMNAQAQKLKNTIPGIIEIFLGERNTQPWAGYADATQGYTHALISRHKTVKDLSVYTVHPDHLALQSRLKKCFAAPPIRMELNASKL